MRPDISSAIEYARIQSHLSLLFPEATAASKQLMKGLSA